MERASDRASERPSERATGERRTTIIVETQETMCLPKRQCTLQKDTVSSRETTYPPERQRVWVWGEYELRYIDPPKELEGYHPLWINKHFLQKANFKNGKLEVDRYRERAHQARYFTQRSRTKPQTVSFPLF